MDLYYNNATVDGQWDTIGNWWLDSIYTLPASSYGLPQAGDNVYIDSDLSTGPSTPVVLADIICGSINVVTSFAVDLGNATTNSSYEFYNDVVHIGSSVFGSYYFYGNSINSGTVDSNNTSSGFFDNSLNTGTANNDTSFSNNSQNTGTCNNNASFADSSYNTGTVVEDATFNTFTDLGSGAYEDTLGYGIGTVNGIVAGSGSQLYSIQYISNNMTGEIVATTYPFGVEFTNSTTNNGTIDIGGVSQFIDTSINQDDVVGDAAFSDGSYNDTTGSVGGNATFNGTSYNIGTVTGNATFNYAGVVNGIADDTTGYSSGIVDGVVYGAGSAVITTWRFSGDLLNTAVCSGNAIFTGNSTYGNSGVVEGDASFYNGSGNFGTVEGTTYIYNDSRNTGTVQDIVYKSVESAKLAIQNGDTGTVNGTVSFPFADILGTGLQ